MPRGERAFAAIAQTCCRWQGVLPHVAGGHFTVAGGRNFCRRNRHAALPQPGKRPPVTVIMPHRNSLLLLVVLEQEVVVRVFLHMQLLDACIEQLFEFVNILSFAG